MKPALKGGADGAAIALQAPQAVLQTGQRSASKREVLGFGFDDRSLPASRGPQVAARNEVKARN